MPEHDATQTRLAELEAERDRLQAELDSVANRATDRWLGAASFESKALAAMQQTISWRVTKPLRIVRSLPSLAPRPKK
ncbi:hypothetical protein [Subtercola endophyticus]|uniref:hypothetical protein n=1 Tax=Subtercola endophyticus TaxID=2895559 RepID=UPI001E29F710|nr:hypothetical protein [Subtercola endophyticus]UFS57743.1 hypothetical protein LQ955_11860 [Subtercola endophyticus]